MRGLVIGRFQPFHRGHLALIRAIRRRRRDETLLLAVGSAQESFTAENPFTAGERLEMIGLALDAARFTSCQAVPVTDIHRHALWVRHLETLLPSFDRVYTNNPLTRLLFEADEYPVESPKLQERDRWQGSFVRQRLREGSGWEPLVPPVVRGYLQAINAVGRLQQIAARDDAAAPP